MKRTNKQKYRFPTKNFAVKVLIAYLNLIQLFKNLRFRIQLRIPDKNNCKIM